ncbi:hypothetical protein [Escherichia coli]|uniref:hypothetical protein n=1 Tax=Escherichia coli TaxID=562 RepID=UPI001BD25591|nr:hypothetical protein [Escherichia coli]MBS9628468.1 hypothetical protein [Escherichia coli]
MKSRMKLMVRAYDKALMVFDFLQHNKRERRRWARLFAREWHEYDATIDCQRDADELADDNIKYMMRW